jgi:hypothetical protein
MEGTNLDDMKGSETVAKKILGMEKIFNDQVSPLI